MRRVIGDSVDDDYTSGGGLFDLSQGLLARTKGLFPPGNLIHLHDLSSVTNATTYSMTMASGNWSEVPTDDDMVVAIIATKTSTAGNNLGLKDVVLLNIGTDPEIKLPALNQPGSSYMNIFITAFPWKKVYGDTNFSLTPEFDATSTGLTVSLYKLKGRTRQIRDRSFTFSDTGTTQFSTIDFSEGDLVAALNLESAITTHTFDDLNTQADAGADSSNGQVRRAAEGNPQGGSFSLDSTSGQTSIDRSMASVVFKKAGVDLTVTEGYTWQSLSETSGTITETGVSFGTDTDNRWIYLLFANYDLREAAVTIGGVTAEKVGDSSDSISGTEIWRAQPSGTSGTIEITHTGSSANANFQVLIVKGSMGCTQELETYTSSGSSIAVGAAGPTVLGESVLLQTVHHTSQARTSISATTGTVSYDDAGQVGTTGKYYSWAVITDMTDDSNEDVTFTQASGAYVDCTVVEIW